MENFTLQNQFQTDNIIKYKTNSLVSTMLAVTLNQVMTAKSVLQAKSNTLLLQKDVDLDKLVNIKLQQEQMRNIASRYLDQHLPKILALLTDITGLYSNFNSYYEDVNYYINKLNTNDADEKKGLLIDLGEMLNDIINVTAEKKKNANTLVKILASENEKNATFSEKLNQTKAIAEQFYVGDKTAISTLEYRIQDLLKDIEQCNNQIAYGALDSAKNILKISTTFITKYIPETKPDVKPDTKTLKSMSITNEPIPIVANNLQLFSGNKVVATLSGKKLQESIALYRECIEQLQKYNTEAAIFSVLMQQWDAFINGMVVIAASIDYLAKAWQELEQNFTMFKEKLSVSEANIDESDIENRKQQWSLSNVALRQLNNKAIDFQRLAYLDIVKDQDEGKDISSYAFRTVLNVPNLKNSQLNQKIIIENSKK
ncbi:MAG: HBL/NHE enterotoxin family protein [Candidatus Aquirickettsiella sp.]